MAVPTLSDAALDKLGALIVHSDDLIEEIYASGGQPTVRMGKLIRLVRDDLADHNLMALKVALDREGRLPK